MKRWQIGKQTVIEGDCLEVLRTMAAELVDVVATSIPYNIGVEYNQYDDRLPRDVYLSRCGEGFTEQYRVLKPDGSFFLNIGTGTKEDPALPYAIIDRALAAGFVLQNEITWVKAIVTDGVLRGHVKPVNSRKYLDRAHEKVLHFTKRGDVLLDKLAVGVPFADKSNIARRGHAQDLRCGTNVWFIPYSTVQSKAEKFNHPAGFPVELPTRCIKLHGVRPGLVVLDPFAGAGTTLVASQTLGCHGIGIEIDAKYVESTIQRLQALVPAGQAKLQHSRIGPSRAALIWHCPGSVQAEDAAGRPPAGEAAERGTELHAIAEKFLRAGKAPTGEPEVVAYVTEVQRLAAAAGVTPLIEHRVDLSAHHPELFGTLDAAVVDLEHGVLTIADFKSGLHEVPADALQLKLYGGMAFVSLPPAEARRIRWIDTVVIQPNGGGDPIRRMRHRIADVLTTLGDYIDGCHIATGEADPPRTAGPWCRQYFCAARSTCPAFRELALREARSVFTREEVTAVA